MLPLNGVLPVGLHRRHGCQIAALAGAVENLPDWHGAAVVCSHATFAIGHRVWGHNLLACLAVGALLGTLLVSRLLFP
jgi:hypothetical protein